MWNHHWHASNKCIRVGVCFLQMVFYTFSFCCNVHANKILTTNHFTLLSLTSLNHHLYLSNYRNFPARSFPHAADPKNYNSKYIKQKITHESSFLQATNQADDGRRIKRRKKEQGLTNAEKEKGETQGSRADHRRRQHRTRKWSGGQVQDRSPDRPSPSARLPLAQLPHSLARGAALARRGARTAPVRGWGASGAGGMRRGLGGGGVVGESRCVGGAWWRVGAGVWENKV